MAVDADRAARDILSLCRELEAEGIRYCHWKSNESLHRSVTGKNDLDLLVSRADTVRFEEILRRRGYKEVQPPAWKQLPGVWHAYGLGSETGRLVHIHAHYQLVVGDDMTKNYRLPIEEPYLASAVHSGIMRIPAPEYELGVFLVRMVIKHCSWDALLSMQGSLSASERRELSYLLERAEPEVVWTTMAAHLPFIPRELWEACLRSVQPGSSLLSRIMTARELHRQLAVCSRRPIAIDTYLKIWRRCRTVLHRALLRRSPGLPRRMSAGGIVVAVVGGDGAGKSTVVEGLVEWLSKEIFTVRVHLGKPPRSLLSSLLKKAMGAAASMSPKRTSSTSALRASLAEPAAARMDLGSYARLVWQVLNARDRYRAYRRARRLATNGAIVICDRYPLPQIKLMDGAVTGSMAEGASRTRLLDSLSTLEQGYYARITYPDVLIVLKVDPDIAVLRKQDEENESFLRPRSEEIWNVNWADTKAVVVDADRPKGEVLSEIKSVVWSRL